MVQLKFLMLHSGTCLKRPPLGPKLLAALDWWSMQAMQVVLNVEGSIRTIGRGRDREVFALYRWPLVQVPL